MPTCEQLSRLLAGDRLDELGLSARLMARLHRMVCGPCRHYAADLARIGDAARAVPPEADSTSRAEDRDRLDRLERVLMERLQKR